MLHAVFHKWLKKKDGQLHRKKFRRNIDVEAEFPRKTDVLDRHVTLYLLQFFLKRCNREFFQVVADQIGHAGGDRFNLRNLIPQDSLLIGNHLFQNKLLKVTPEAILYFRLLQSGLKFNVFNHYNILLIPWHCIHYYGIHF